MKIIWCIYIWLLRYKAYKEKLFQFDPLFAILPPPPSWQSERTFFFAKMRKNTWRLCTKSDNHYDVGFSDMECDRQNFLSFWTFCPLIPLSTPGESKFSINEKNARRYILILHKCTINENHKMYGSWDMECNRQNFISGHFLSFYPFSNLRNQNLKKWKRRLEIW